MTRLMALDVGEVRIGVAMSDESRFLASPCTTLHVSRNEEQLWIAIEQLIAEHEVAEVVVGLPISLDGQIHAQGKRVQAFAEWLKQHIAIPVTFWDERLSTVEAQRLRVEPFLEGRESRRRQGSRGQAHKKRRRKGHEIDALAATVILQEYLDHQRSISGKQSYEKPQSTDS